MGHGTKTIKTGSPPSRRRRRDEEQRLTAELMGGMAAFEAARAGKAGEELALRVAELLEAPGPLRLSSDRREP